MFHGSKLKIDLMILEAKYNYIISGVSMLSKQLRPCWTHEIRISLTGDNSVHARIEENSRVLNGA